MIDDKLYTSLSANTEKLRRSGCLENADPKNSDPKKNRKIKNETEKNITYLHCVN